MDTENLTELEMSRQDIASLISNENDVNVKAAYVYNRKGHPTYDDVVKSRNTSYGSTLDDIVCVITVAVPHWSESWQTLCDIGKEIRRQELEAKVASAREVLDRAEAQLAELDVS